MPNVDISNLLPYVSIVGNITRCDRDCWPGPTTRHWARADLVAHNQMPDKAGYYNNITIRPIPGTLRNMKKIEQALEILNTVMELQEDE